MFDFLGWPWVAQFPHVELVGGNVAKLVRILLLDLLLHLVDKAIGRHPHKEGISQVTLKVVIDESAPHLSDWHCHDGRSSWSR